MPNFDSNDPRQFGASLGFRSFVPFTYAGRVFPQGVHPLCYGVFTLAIDRLVAAGWQLPPVSLGLGAGCWGQEDRTVKDGTSTSFHQYGYAIDLAAPWNPWRVANPPASKYRLPDNTSALVEPLGLLWGGSPRWGSNRDRMHIENHNSPLELTKYPRLGVKPPAPPPGRPPAHPYPLPVTYYYGPYSGGPRSISGYGKNDGPYRAGLASCQAVLRTDVDGLYGPLTSSATRHWQRANALEVDGLIGPMTWRKLFPR